VRRVLLWYLHTAAAAVTALQVEAGPRDLPASSVPALAFRGDEDALQWYRQERINLVAVVRTAEEQEMDDVAWLLPAVVYPLHARYNYFDDWITTSSIALGAVRRLNERRGEAEILASLGKAHARHLSRKRGVEFQNAALAIYRDLRDPLGEATSANALGLTHLSSHQLAEALSFFQRTNEIAIQLDNQFWLALSTNNIANVRLELEEFSTAVDMLTVALVMCRRLGIPGTEGDALRGLSQAYRGLGWPAEAEQMIDEALRIAREHENSAWEAFWLTELGRVQVDLGDPGNALESFRRAAASQRQLGDRTREADAYDATGEAYQAMGRHDEAVNFHRLAVATFRELDEQWRLALALHHVANALHGQGEGSEARRLWSEALHILTEFTDPRALRIQSEIQARL
jgi:tetratricopeptide (TPR) repeat protein